MANEGAPSTGELAPGGEDDGQSLNAGIVIQDGPVPDPLTTELEGEPDVILGALKELNEEDPIVTESIYADLSYLREDIVNARGMSQKLATEAISIKPGFGRGKPIAFYSKHVSVTGFQAAIEEIDQSAVIDLDCQIQSQIIQLKRNSANPGRGFLIENIDWERRLNQVCMMYYSLREFKRLVADTGMVWDDPLFQAAACDPTQNATVPEVLRIPKKIVSDFANMEGYYMAHVEAPSMMEMLTVYMRQWREAFQAHLDALKEDSGGKVQTTSPKAPSVGFYGGKTTSILGIAQAFRDAFSDAKEPEGFDTLDLACKMENAITQAKVNDILPRAKMFMEESDKLASVLEEIRGYLNSYNKFSDNLTFVTDGIYKLVSDFAKVNRDLSDASTEILKWVANASTVTTYAATLYVGVADVAWKAVNQCKDSMQMPEEKYDAMKCSLDDLKQVLVVNAA